MSPSPEAQSPALREHALLLGRQRKIDQRLAELAPGPEAAAAERARAEPLGSCVTLAEELELCMRALELEGAIVRTGEMRPNRDGILEPVFVAVERRRVSPVHPGAQGASLALQEPAMPRATEDPRNRPHRHDSSRRTGPTRNL
jgi:hypothetical protein